MLATVKHRAEKAAKKAGLLSAASLFLLAGLGFLTLASWLYLVTLMTSLEAALVLALVFIGIAVTFLGLALRNTEDERPEPPKVERTEGGPALIQAFLHGIEAGSRAKQR